MKNTVVPDAREVAIALARAEASLPSYGAPELAISKLCAIASRDPALLLEIVENMLHASGSMSGVWRLALANIAQDDWLDKSDDWYRTLIAILPIADQIFIDTPPPGYTMSVLRKYVDVSKVYVGYRPDGTNEHLLKAAIIVLHVTDSKGNRLKELRNEMLFVAENLDQLQPFLSIIKKRKNVSVPFLQELLNGEAHSLTSGIL